MLLLIADSQSKVRYALSLLVQEHPGWQVAATAVDENDLLVKLAAFQPDVLLLDWNLPGLPAEDRLEHLRALPALPIIVATSPGPEISPVAFAEGANYFLCKVDPPSRWLEILNLCEHSVNLRSVPKSSSTSVEREL